MTEAVAEIFFAQMPATESAEEHWYRLKGVASGDWLLRAACTVGEAPLEGTLERVLNWRALCRPPFTIDYVRNSGKKSYS